MKHQRQYSHGFHIIELVVALCVLGLIALLGFVLINNSRQTPPSAGSAASGESPIWEYDQQKLTWRVKSGTAPACKDPFKLDVAPVDMANVMMIGLPGAYRGYNYKAHGLYRLADSTKGFTEIKMPMDAKLMSITRYYERVPGYDYELQYILDFESDCGIAFRFDHLHTLAPAFQTYANQSPKPKKDDTRTDPNAQPIRKLFKAGDVIATRAGFPGASNYGFDFGVYDYRKPNDISKNKQWAAIHQSFSAQHFYGVCWLSLLPGADAAAAEAIAKDQNNYDSNKPFNLTSDYCDFAPHNTLEYNSGQPTDG